MKQGESSTKKKGNLKIGKETYGTIPREEAFRKAFELLIEQKQKV
ncbi:hypothetical protein [Radiobacillus sp. PE A8.2]